MLRRCSCSTRDVRRVQLPRLPRALDGDLCRSAALALELVARAVLIVELTASAVLLGAVLAAWMAPNLLLSPFAGAIVDRYPYRRVLIGSFLANAAASGVLFAGLLLSIAEFTWMFGLMTAFSLLPVLLGVTIQAQQESKADGDEVESSIIGQIAAGGRWAIDTRWPLEVLAISAMSYMFLQPYEAVLMPLVVIDELGQHRSWVGYLAAVGGLGATLGLWARSGWPRSRKSAPRTC